ncbi:MAG: dihydrofolate reductase family protein [Leifsonia sp.]
MSDVFVDITMAVDGHVAGPDVGRDHPLGVGGERLHEWLFGSDGRPPSAEDTAVAAELFDGTGAFVMGRRTFDVGIDLWGPDGAFGVPTFVVTHAPHPDVVRGPTTFRFITTGLTDAIAAARSAAADRNVAVMGGADIATQAIGSGLVDELRLHLVPVVLGSGARLFAPDGPRIELVHTRTIESSRAVHLRYRVLGNAD